MTPEKPRFRVGIDGSNPRLITNLENPNAPGFVPWGPLGSASSFEAAGFGRRLRNFNPSRAHINAALERAGRTIVKRARYLIENNGYAGNAVDVWVAWVVGEGVVPRLLADVPREKRKKISRLWRRWAKEADADGVTNFYGLQERIARETFIAGECFVRLRGRRPRDVRTVPLQLQVLPSEMLDLTFNQDLGGGRQIRMGIEFDAIGRRVAYHFWRHHPDDYLQVLQPAELRTRVPAQDVLHVLDARQSGQIRGVPRMARAIVKLFMLDIYDDAELDRKKTAALYAGFVTKTGDASPIDPEEHFITLPDGTKRAAFMDSDALPELQPGAMLDLAVGEKVEWSQPADVGGSYEPFQYRTLLQVGAALGIPYAYLTGDAAKGNFSNVRTEIMNFRRRVGQFQYNVLIPQGCEPIWSRWLDVAELSGLIDGVDDDVRDEDWLPPRMEYVDPRNDVIADRDAVRAGFKTRSRVIASSGYDREEVDDEFEAEFAEADRRGFIFDTDPRRVSSVGMTNAVQTGSGFASPEDELPDPQDVRDDKSEEGSGNRPARNPSTPKRARPQKGVDQ